jgi:hypothetical protein
VDSERAWITAKVKEIRHGLNVDHIPIEFKNEGRTSAKVQRICVTRLLVPFPESGWGRPGELPAVPVYSDPEPTVVTQGKDFIVAPSGTHLAYTFLFPRDLELIKARKVSLYVYGEIEYLDTIRLKSHKTCFCEIYFVEDKASNERAGFRFAPNLIPPAYICAT